MSRIVIFIFILQLNVTEPESLSCIDRDSCRGVVLDHRDEIKERNCFCDQVCIQYDDCCADFPKNDSLFTSIGTCIDYMYPFRIRSQSYVPTVMPVWMIDRCLEHYRWTTLEKNCSLPEYNDIFFSEPAAFIPITSQSTNSTYRNVFCALCNDETIDKLNHWSLDVVCQGLKKNYVYHYENGLDLIHLPPEDAEQCVHRLIFPSNLSTKISPCKKQTIKSCPTTYTTNQTIIDLCSTVNAYRYVTHSHPQLIREHSLYRNEFCLECHDVRHSRNYLGTSCEHQLDDELFIDPKPKTGRHGFYRLSILFDPQIFARSFPKTSLIDLRYHSSYQTHISSIYPCRDTEFYDFNLHHCLMFNNEIDWRLSQSFSCDNFVLIREENDNDQSETIEFDGEILSRKQGDFIRLFSDRKKILLCAERFPFIYIHYNRWITTIRYSSTLVSTIALLIFLIAFYQKSSLHNLPGRCLLCLSVCLQLSQLAFLASGHLIDSIDRWTCIATGMIIHFFYLSTFAWLTVISFDTCITLTQMHRVDARMATNRIILYNVCVWSFSAFFLFVSIILFILLPRDHRWSPNYGRLICSISSPLILILFFLLPIGFLLLINLCLFFRTVLVIRRIDRDTQLARCLTDQDRSRTILYLRLAFLMGLHWLFLVICLLFRDEFLWFIFDLSHAFPSLFISIGFLRQHHQTSHIRSSQSQGSSIGTTTRTVQSHSDASPNIQMVRKLDDITVKLENISRQLLRPRPIPTDRHSVSSL